MTEETKPTSKIALVKTITRNVVGYSTGAVVVSMIHQNTTPFTKSQKAQLVIGAFVIGTMVADKARDWSDAQIDMIVKTVGDIRESLADATDIT